VDDGEVWISFCSKGLRTGTGFRREVDLATGRGGTGGRDGVVGGLEVWSIGGGIIDEY